MDIILTAVISILATLALSFLAVRGRLAQAARTQAEHQNNTHALERQIHTNEAGFLQAKNQMEIQHHEQLKLAREQYLQEGIEAGKSLREKDHQIEITNLRSELREQCARDCQQAEENGKRLARAELESQTKAFSVSIQPYVRIEKTTGILWNANKSVIGYQYQLLVNGIPAFQPHIVIEKTESLKEVNQETLDKLAQSASVIADKAISTYLGNATGSMLQRGSAIVREEVVKR
ncbi:MAG: hypothetical protein CVV07_06285 [Gammaproteobacteria bacterium HGW-Gammaproteobacteria-11]|nr:MAG: hypothetical protein CVV07_06285 [Gammaproteobacteria bacterium HGW-Gammaproteobacteria-11]